MDGVNNVRRNIFIQQQSSSRLFNSICYWYNNNRVVQQMSWSKKYYTGLTNTQHNINDDWFKNVLRVLKDSGILHVPNLNKSFNKKGEEINESRQQTNKKRKQNT